MTLAVRPKPPANHKKRVGQHRTHNKHYAKAYWPYLPIVAVLVLGMVANVWFGRVHHDVLGYATEMSVQNLLDGTNKQRVANGLGSLALNSQLNQAAQAKANDMSARNYWSHNTPDGQTPWTFVSAAGYDYQAIGENLAYGFSTSSDTIAGWMNSPGHRANILNSNYLDVGFGVINIPDYQSSGPQTLVVAFYGHAATTVAAPAPTPVAPAPTAVSQTGTSGGTPTPVSTEETVPASSVPATVTPSTTKDDTLIATKPIDKSVEARRIARVQLFTSGNASWSLFAVTILSTLAVVAFALRHALAWHRFLRKGERFVLHHPAFDIAMIGLAMLGYIMVQTSGFIR
ncbi:MAG: CAP domain-containing protein [Candidatus Saccharimonadales bacterium]